MKKRQFFTLCMFGLCIGAIWAQHIAYINADMELYEDAIQWYFKSIEIDPSNDITYNALGSLYRKLGRFKEAKENYFESLRIDNTYAVTHFNYGNLFYYF